MKKLLSLFLVLSLVMALAISMASCLNNKEDEEEVLVPNSDPYKAKENLEANGYDTHLLDNEYDFDYDGLVAQLSASLNDDEEILMVYYFADKSDAEYIWEEVLEAQLEYVKDNLPGKLADEVIIEIDGKLIFIGTENAIKATNKKPSSGKPDIGGHPGLDGVDAEEGRDDFINDLGGVSETYQGAVSEESYSSADEAARDYVYQEIVGEQDVTIESTTSKGELNNSEIDRLNLPADVTEGMQSVEKLEVEYTVYSSAMQSDNNGEIVPLASDTLNTTKKVVVYVIKYEHDWKYFTPCPVTGDTLSKSYYDSVFDNDKYQNCTMVTNREMLVDIKGTGADGGYIVTMTQIIKHADGKVYFEQIIEITATGAYVGMEDDLGIPRGELYAYMEENEYGNMVCYVKQGKNSTEWYEGYLHTIGFGSIKDLTPFSNQYLDYTYFTKTDFGFTLQDENAQKYIDKALSGVTSSIQGDWDYNMYSEYYVSEGVLSGMRSDIEVAFDVVQSGIAISMLETLTENITCKDYGTTVVEKPFS